MKIDFNQIKVIEANKTNKEHREGVWTIKNNNLKYNLVTSKPILYEDHCDWWKSIFDTEYLYLILYNSEISGYIRLTKVRTHSKELNEISIALIEKVHNSGIGTYAYNLFEKMMMEKNIFHLVALTDIKNKQGQKFFEKQGFKKSFLRYIKKL